MSEQDSASEQGSASAHRGNRPAALDATLCEELGRLLDERHGLAGGEDGTLTVSGEMTHGYARVGVTLERGGGDERERLTLEVSVELEPNALDNPIEARDVAIDALDGFLGEALGAGPAAPLPGEWLASEFEGRTVNVRGERRRPALDDEADRLLAAAGFDRDGHAVE